LYEGFYQLKQNPFRLSPDPAFMCMTSQHQEALSGLVYTVCTRSGLTVFLGEAGTGKTTLLYSLLALLEKRRFCTAMCTNPTLTREEFYDFLMLKFGVNCQSTLKSRQLAALEETLRRNQADGRPSILIVDEAQRLSPELLEEVRLLLNLETPRQKLLEIIVAGQPELADVLNRPELRQLRQRVSCVCRLTPLSFHEAQEYIAHRLARAGVSEQAIFSDQTIALIHEHSHGIPRLINTLCDGSLRIGFALHAHQITAAIVEEALKDLEIDVRKLAPPPQPQSADVEPPAGPLAAQHHAPTNTVALNGRSSEFLNGNVPLETYATRQKSVSFFSNLMDRWRQ
jgi:general secretion pathway protein A